MASMTLDQIEQTLRLLQRIADALESIAEDLDRVVCKDGEPDIGYRVRIKTRRGG